MHDVATQVLICAIAVVLLQIQSHPLDCVQEEPSQDPIQSLHEQDGSQPMAREVPARAAVRKNDFMLMMLYLVLANGNGILKTSDGVLR